MDKDFLFPKRVSLLRRIWEDLLPTPGRLGRAFRMTLTSVVVLILMLVLQLPFIAYALYAIFLINRESPSLSLRSGIGSILSIVAVVGTEMSVVILSDNDPMARVISIAVVSFLAAMIMVATTMPALGPAWGLFYCVVIGFWDRHAPEDTLVRNSLYLLAAFSLAVACSIAVEYIFGVRSPAKLLEEQVSIRYCALEKMFRLYAEAAASHEIYDAANAVSRLAVAGTSGMMILYQQIADRDSDTGGLSIGTRVRITMLAELLDDAAAFGLQGDAHNTPQIRERCAWIAEVCRHSITQNWSHFKPDFATRQDIPISLLDRVEAAVNVIFAMPRSSSSTQDKKLAVLVSRKVPFIIPGAINDRNNVAFALKISLCATICYVVYNAIDWPGISTSVTTVIIAGLTTTAATKQRLTFRLFGSILGGLIFGLGATVFLFPHMDSITALIVLIAPIAFLSSWIAGGARFNYVGLQIAFGFYLVGLVDFRAPTELAPARDRLVGIIFAIVVMWFVFDQVWPVRTITAMRRTLGSVLRGGASLFLLIDQAVGKNELLGRSNSLRDELGKNIAALRTMSETIEFEFGADRDQSMQTSEILVQISVTAAALVWNQVAYLHTDQPVNSLRYSSLTQMRRELSESLDRLAAAIVDRTAMPPRSRNLLIDNIPGIGEPDRDYIRNTIARHEDLQTLVSMLGSNL